VIGRQTSADLQIRDGAISRRHAAVIRRNSSFYIKDLGSIAGVVYKGMRIDNKRIDEGDVFELAGYQLRFTFLVD
jgi:neural Wiskott-Aldrich syndrome protein